MSTSKKILPVFLLLALFVCPLSGCSGKNIPAKPKLPLDKSSTINKNIVSGTGTLEARDHYDVGATVIGNIVDAPFKEGQNINIGDILYKIDQTDILNSIEKAKLEAKKVQLAYEQNEYNINKLSIRSNINGKIKNIYINTGDMIMANSKIADVVNDSQMLLKVPFLPEEAKSISVGQSATITINGYFETMQGTVKKISSGDMPDSRGVITKVVEILVTNPGAISKGDKATASVNSFNSIDSGIFDYSEYETVIAEVSGKVSSIYFNTSDNISKNTSIAVLENNTMVSQQQQNKVLLQEATLALENLTNTLKDYTIVATMKGVVTKKNLNTGDIVNAGNMYKMATIADISNILFRINVDELDVSKITIGQKASFTVDAIPDKSFSGIVEFVNKSGTLVNGVSLYEIKINVPSPGELLPGMNVSAKIDAN